jgi:hypothetical protein
MHSERVELPLSIRQGACGELEHLSVFEFVPRGFSSHANRRCVFRLHGGYTANMNALADLWSDPATATRVAKVYAL